MFIKKIELNGFKSFPVKRTIELSRGITIIVGSNGCGKSNIFDSIRWVMGESNSRELRGERMGDFIFQGSRNYKPQSLAQVSLFIDNADRRIPLDFEEIMITRKLYREGEDQFVSKYILNGGSCLRKDITGLFMDTGVGADGFSIMEQDQVALIVRAKPRDRRFIIDEAAGISKYRVQKESALRKLEHTEQELTRHYDILSVMEREVEKLKRQAKKAERWKKLEAEITGLESVALVKDFRRAQEARAENERALRELNDRLHQLQTALAACEARRAETEFKQQELEQALQELNEQKHRAQSEAQAIEGRAALLREKIASLCAQLDAEREQLAAGRRESAEQRNRLDAVNGELEHHQRELARLEQRHAELKQAQEQLLQGRQQSRAKLQALRFTARQHHEAALRGEGEIRVAEAQLEQALNQLAEQQQLAAQLDARLAEHDRNRAALAAALDECERSIKQFGTQLGKIETKHARALERRGKIEARAEELRAQIHEKSSRLNGLRQLEENYQGFHRGVKEVMRAVEQGKFNHVHGVLAQLIHIRKEHEKAIESALASHLQDIVTETAESAHTAIQYLKTQRLGRASFIPLDLIELRPAPLKVLAAVTRPGVVGLAAQLVECGTQVQPAVDFLLGQILVVEDLRNAEAMLREGIRTRFVSLDGDLLSDRGLMSGGQIQTSGLLTREREIRELEAEIAQLRQREAEAAPELAALHAELRELEQRQAELQGQLHQAELDAARQQQDRLAHQAQRESLEQQREQSRRKEEQLNQLLEQHERQIQELMRTIDDDRLLQQQAETEIALLENGGDGDAPVDAEGLQREFSEAYGRLTEARERLSRLQERKGALTDAAGKLEAQLRRLEETLHGGSRQQGELARELDGTQQQLRDKLAELDVLESKVRDETGRRLEQDELLLQLKNQIEETFRDERQTENLIQDQRVKQNEIELREQNLGARALERFNRPLRLLVEEAPQSELAPQELNAQLTELRSRRDAMGPINSAAIDEYAEIRRRYDEYNQQVGDLTASRESLLKTIRKIDETSERMFLEAYTQIRDNFREIFRRLFGGGRADLVLTEEQDVLNSGIDIIAMPPGSQVKNIMLQSGGEKSMVAIALLFAVFQYKPSPFCVLDEVDHALDDQNVGRFKRMIQEFTGTTQFLIITHNKLTMEMADTIYGVTMHEKGVTDITSIRFVENELAVG